MAAERGRPDLGVGAITARGASYRDALGLDAGLDFRSLRRAYVTHLIEDGLGAGVRPAAGRPRTRVDHGDLHLRVVGLPHPHPAAGSRPGPLATSQGPGQEGPTVTETRKVRYRWRLREMMAAHGLFPATELVPLLHRPRHHLSAFSGVHHLVSRHP